MGKVTWKYQLMRYDDGSLGVHEYYSDGAHTVQPIIVGDSLKDILKILKMIENDVKSGEILDYKD